MIRVLKILWFSVLLWALGFALLNSHSPEAEIPTIYAVMVLAFPSGGLLALVCGVLLTGLDHLGIRLPHMPSFLLFWSAGVVLGYFQWFVALPRLIAKFRQSKRGQQHNLEVLPNISAS